MCIRGQLTLFFSILLPPTENKEFDCESQASGQVKGKHFKGKEFSLNAESYG